MSRQNYRLNRRSVLRGVGTAGLVLPFLESIPERSAFAQNETPRFGFFVCTSCGVVQNQFWPSATGALTAASMAADSSSKATGILADYADRLLIVKGMKYPSGLSDCGHAQGLVQCLTASSPTGGAQNTTSTAISCDNAIANALDVVPLTVYAGLKGGYIEEKLSFTGAGKVRGAQGNPYQVYLDLAGLLDSSTGAPTPMADQLALRRNSINDLVRDDLASLLARPEMSYADKLRLQLHLDSIRDMENQIQNVSSVSCSGANLNLDALKAMDGGGSFGGAPYEADGSQEEVAKLHMELVALAFACNTTQVATLQIGDGTDGTRYTIDGQKLERFHYISHRVMSDSSSGTAIAGAEGMHAKIDRLRMETLKYALDKWSLYETPNGPLLDNGFIYWTNHIADGPSHSFTNVPVVIAGSGGGYLKQGAYIDIGATNNGGVLSTMMNANGVPTQTFGSGGGGVVSAMLANG